MTISVKVELNALDPAQELAALSRDVPNAGAVVSFVGLTRDRTDAAAVAQLYLDWYPGMTETGLKRIAEAAMARFDICAVRIVHRAGALSPRDPIVFTGVAATHRQPAFAATDYLMDRLKTEAMFWKREDRSGHWVWIEPRPEDHAARAKWEAAS